MMKRLWIVPLVFVLGCGGGGGLLADRVVVIGVDGLDPELFATLRERGELPNFDRLLAEGVASGLLVDEPIFSPRIWTSIFTGFRSEHHGIESFTLPSGEEGRRVPVTSNLVKRRRVWDIFGDKGLGVGVVGHWLTWPAEPVNGFLLSFYTWPPSQKFEKEWAPSADWDTVGFRTWPEGILGEVDEAVKNKRYVRWMDVEGSTQMTNELKWYLRKDLDMVNAGLALYDRDRPRFFTLYLESPDFYSHKLWLFHRYNEFYRHNGSLEGLEEPERTPPPMWLGEMGPMVANTYKYADKVLGLVLERVDLSKDAVIVVSDHGFSTFPDEPELHVGDERYVKMPFWHDDTGLFVAAGPPFRKGGRGPDLRPEDVTPVLLAVTGVPRGEDMDGRAPEGLFDEAFMKKHPVRSVPTYETGEAAGGGAVEAPFNEAVLEQLRSLGYLE
ncbi:MAG: alkaline phosphatase family protein [Candidatus Eisenbacteria bacterium]